jgi:hypothetical protein
VDPVQQQGNFFGAPPPAAEMPPPTAPPTAVPMTPENAGPRQSAVPTWGDSQPASEYAPPVMEAAPEPPAPPAAPAAPSYDELRSQIENLNRRLADTQAGFHRANNNSQLASEIVSGLASYAEARRQQDYARDSFQPPTVQDPDALLTDPGVLMNTMGQYVDYGYRRAVAEMAPHVQTAAGMAQVAPVIIQNQMDMVADRVSQQAAREGVTEQEFGQLYDQATQIVMAGNIPDAEKIRLRLRPDAMLAAVRMARDSRGPRTPAPPSLGPNGGGPGQPRQQSSSYAAGIEQMLGIKFDKNDHAELTRRLAAQGVR